MTVDKRQKVHASPQKSYKYPKKFKNYKNANVKTTELNT